MSGRILVVDSCPIVHEGLCSTFKNTEFSVALATSSVRQAAAWLGAETGGPAPVELILCDFEMEDGSSVALQNVANRMQIPLVVFTGWQNPVYIGRMVQGGAAGLVMKSAPNEELLSSLRKVLSGKKALKRKDTRRVTGALATPRLESHIDIPLTQREFAVLKELAGGQTNKMVAERLGVSYETVKEHVQHILVKLGVSDRTQAAVLAARKGLI